MVVKGNIMRVGIDPALSAKELGESRIDLVGSYILEKFN